jgi:hypothetical protein
MRRVKSKVAYSSNDATVGSIIINRQIFINLGRDIFTKNIISYFIIYLL